jgi:hypothetical protein
MSCLSDADKVLVIRALDAREFHLYERADRMQLAGDLPYAEMCSGEARDAHALRLRIAEEGPNGPEGDAALERYLNPKRPPNGPKQNIPNGPKV